MAASLLNRSRYRAQFLGLARDVFENIETSSVALLASSAVGSTHTQECRKSPTCGQCKLVCGIAPWLSLSCLTSGFPGWAAGASWPSRLQRVPRFQDEENSISVGKGSSNSKFLPEYTYVSVLCLSHLAGFVRKHKGHCNMSSM